MSGGLTTQDYIKLLTEYYYRTQNTEYRAVWQRFTVQRCTVNNRHVQTKTQPYVNQLSLKMSNSPTTTHSIIQNTLCPKKVDHQLMAIILLKPNQFSKLERGINCKQTPYNISHHTQILLRQHTLGVVGYVIWVLFTIYSSFQQWKNFDS